MPSSLARVKQLAARPSTTAILGVLLGVLAVVTAPGLLRVLGVLLLAALVVSVRMCMAARSAKTILADEIGRASCRERV